MILPDDEECRRVMQELEGDPGLTEWQSEFVDRNLERQHFTDRQKEIIAEMKERFEV